ncbi:DUF3299 domain-containing protein [Bremerella cremea]|uniref:DUF3299 domain-containing protein n=1 Tax=Bremerella cremea TaxID=1031537 RepID=A0A368KS50_9BACT|nr:DUF3299 domain-containing protein [Bremerella cremea]
MFLPTKSFSLPSLWVPLVLAFAGCTQPDPSQPTSTTDSNVEADTSAPAASDSQASQPLANNSAAAQQPDGNVSASEKTQVTTDSPQPTAPKSTTPKPQPGKTIDMTFDDIKFDIAPDADFERSMLPQAIEDLKKQKIRIGGFILPGYQSRDIKQFVLVRDNMECCFGPGAALYDCILVEMSGRGVDFTVRPVTVEGEFTIQEYKDGDDKVRAIYHLQGTNVR